MDINLEIKSRENLIHSIIHKLPYIPEKVEYDDLMQIGRESLWKALETFREGKGYSLNTHCYNSVHGDIVNHLVKMQRIKRKDIEIGESDLVSSGIEDDIVGSFLYNEMKKYISDDDFNLFIDKHVNRLSHEELELKYSVCKRTVIRRLERIRDILRDNLVWEL